MAVTNKTQEDTHWSAEQRIKASASVISLCWLCIEEEEAKLTKCMKGDIKFSFIICVNTLFFIQKEIKLKCYFKMMTLMSLRDSEVSHTTIT